MSSRIQIGVRTSPETAEALRNLADSRGISLGDLLTELVDQTSTTGERGLWLPMDEPLEAALRALAAARGLDVSDFVKDVFSAEVRASLQQMVDHLGESRVPDTSMADENPQGGALTTEQSLLRQILLDS